MLKRILLASAFVLGICSAQTSVKRDLGCSPVTASGTTYTCSISPAPAALVTNEAYYMVVDVANTGAATINFNGFGAKSIVKMAGGATTALIANDLRAGSIAVFRYDGTNMQMISQLGNAASYSLPSQYQIRTCEIHIWGTGTSSVLQNTDDEVASCYNGFGVTETISAVKCWADAGSPTVTPIVTGGGSTSILSSALTCGTGSFASGTLNGTPTLSSAATIDGNVTAAGGTATNVRLIFTLTR